MLPLLFKCCPSFRINIVGEILVSTICCAEKLPQLRNKKHGIHSLLANCVSTRVLLSILVPISSKHTRTVPEECVEQGDGL